MKYLQMIAIMMMIRKKVMTTIMKRIMLRRN